MVPSSPRSRRALAAVAALVAVVTGAGRATAEQTPTGVAYHRITFPVDGQVHYSDDFGDCREGCTRHHMGNDLLGAKLMHEVAASAGTIAWVHATNSGTAGNMLQLTGNDGWVYWYIHINNDTPGTDDGKNPAKWLLAPGIHAGSVVKAGQFIAYMGDSGDAENVQPHLHFEIHEPDGTVIDPYTSLRLAQGLAAEGLCNKPTNPAPDPTPQGGAGYWTLGARGAVLGFGSAQPYPANPLPRSTSVKSHAATGADTASSAAVAIAPTASGKGYWIADSSGAVETHGDARSYGSPGSSGSTHLNAAIIAMTATPSGDGYWLLARDGGVFTFGDAKFYGSTGAMKLNAPIIGMGASTGGGGYWLLARDGGMFSFGQAGFHGSLPGLGWCPSAAQAVAFTGTHTGLGYWVVLADGRVLAFGDAEHFGDAPPSARPVAFAVAP